MSKSVAQATPRRRHRRLRIALIVLAVLFVLFNIFVFFILPPLARNIAIKKGTAALGRELSIERIRVNPYTLTATIRNVTVREPDGSADFVRFSELHANLKITSLFRLAPVLSELRVTNPYVHIARLDESTFNFSDLIKPKVEEKEPARFALNNIQIIDGAIDFDDKVIQQSFKLSELNLHIPAISNFEKAPPEMQAELAARLDGRPIKLAATITPFLPSLETHLTFNADAVRLPPFAGYIPLGESFALPSANLTCNLTVDYAKPQELSIGGDLALAEIDVHVSEDQPLLTLPLFKMTGIALRPLEKYAHCDTLTIDHPSLDLVRDAAGRLNLLAILPEHVQNEELVEEIEEEVEEVSQPLLLSIGSFEFIEGEIGWTDRMTPTPFMTTLAPVNLKGTGISTEVDKAGAWNIEIETEAGTKLNLETRLSLIPLAADGGITVTNLKAPKYGPYYEQAPLIFPSGNISFSTAYKIELDGQPRVRLENMKGRITDMTALIREGESPFLQLASLAFEGGELDLVKKEIILDSLALSGLDFKLVRLENGQLDLPRSGKNAPAPAPESEVSPPPHEPWTFLVRQFQLDDSSLVFNDLTTSTPANATAANISLKAENISTRPGEEGSFALAAAIGEEGHLAVEGAIVLIPFSTHAAINLDTVSLLPFQPYFQDLVTITMTDGSLSVQGEAQYAQEQGTFTAEFDAGVYDISTVTKSTGADFAGWSALNLNGVRLSISPFTLVIDELALVEPRAAIAVSADGSVNLTDIVVAGEGETLETAAETEPAQAENPPPFALNKINVSDGAFNFTDETVKPAFTYSLEQTNLAVEGFSLDGETMANVNFSSLLNGRSPLSAAGHFRPAPDQFFLDMKVTCVDVRLSPMTPYSIKYVGYAIDQGQLTLELEYLIQQSKLDSSNRILLDQLDFGNKVEGDTAVKLPVKLAVALLKDRKGRIEIEIPVTGDLDDPQFRILPIILRTLRNLVTRAIASPFALLTRGTDETNYVEFETGRTELTEKAEKKLDELASGLADKPNLRLEVRMDILKGPEEENALRRKILTRMVRQLKQRKDDEKVSDLDRIPLSADEWARYLKQLYRTLPAELRQKNPTTSVMEDTLMSRIELMPGDYMQLAYDRTQAVGGYLLAKGLEPERIALMEPREVSRTGLPQAVFDLRTTEEPPPPDQLRADFNYSRTETPLAEEPRPSWLKRILIIGGAAALIGAGILAL